MKKTDVIIIGGGASGMCAALVLKNIAPKLNIVILEQLSRVGKKLIVTGNGRCNITNKNIEMSRYHSENTGFCEYALTKFNNSEIESFFERIGVLFVSDEENRVYPYSFQASSVVDALRFSNENCGVITYTDTKAEKISKDSLGYTVHTASGDFFCSALVVASGLLSGGKKLGSDGSVLRLLRDDFGYKTVNLSPAIVQLKTENDVTKRLKGIKVNATVSIKCENGISRTEYGEVLFCDYGLSGPPVLQVSRLAEREKGKKTVSLDLMPQYDYSALCDMLKERSQHLKGREYAEFFTGMLNKRLGQTVLLLCKKKLNDKVCILSNKEIKEIASRIKNFSFNVISTTGFDNSQVTAGGLDTKQFNPETMMSKKDKGLFAVGEVLDVDGDCGGFNLQWAWSSAMCAALGVKAYLENKK